MNRWNGAAAATWNRHLSALTSFTTWAQRHELLETNPARRLTRRKPARRGDRSMATGNARLLPRLLKGRTAGPVFLADRRAPASGARAPAAADICPATGRGRLSYPQAEYLFKTAPAGLDPHGRGWTLHQLRHSALQHPAAAGRTAAELQANSRHAHLASLAPTSASASTPPARLPPRGGAPRPSACPWARLADLGPPLERPPGPGAR
ncbi:hypothetical protein [Actinomadura miaoliensis]|uniref:Core-binding (CB) domain-containing protein n=1 Tax=Actinomadura miaoliensis TaxID=430685 RepID=A0ABP7VLI5_9ACTN